MKIEKQLVKLMDMYGEPLTREKCVKICKALEAKGRTCYKSADKITDDSYVKFLQNLIKNGHESVLEHCSISAYIVTNKAIETEIVRHRLASYSISSTRYCNFSQDKFGNEITVIEPCYFVHNNGKQREAWESAMREAEANYLYLVNHGCKPDQARGVLPLDVKSEINMTCNLRELRHFLKMRCSKRAHEQIKDIALEILGQAYDVFPVIFDDLWEEYGDSVLPF